MKTYIYINDVFKHTWTEEPMRAFPSYTYVSLEAIKNVLTDEEFKELRIKLRKYGVQGV